ncbi:hypothetical protein LRS74_20925 [Streptomyces sp. LX-29]|uniref:hypothetical protein n=1 Tax=Streptomyces sp. LX-29 TaxID=2900152 RepID=UPI00240E21FC|nr:hypothetical protein [Streptomyces sp. LX-29]WFB09224.1 hypothetical protein LRS74_20925 [Streptomyces sp. LX-29]
MDLTPYVENLRHELAVAAAAGGEEARALAERLTAPLESATRLTLLNALSSAMGEITRELAPGSVDVRLRGLDPEFVVTPAPGQEPGGAVEEPEAAPAGARAAAPVDLEDGGTARINFRLPANLKTRIEEAAGQEGLSVNAWLVRAAAAALEPVEQRPRTSGRGHWGQQSYTGWVH